MMVKWEARGAKVSQAPGPLLGHVGIAIRAWRCQACTWLCLV